MATLSSIKQQCIVLDEVFADQRLSAIEKLIVFGVSCYITGLFSCCREVALNVFCFSPA